MEFYIQTLLKMNEACKNFKEEVINIFFKDPLPLPLQGLWCYFSWYQSFLRPIKRIVEVIEIFGIEELEVNKERLQEIITYLETPERVRLETSFRGGIDKLAELFSREPLKEAIRKKLSILELEEINRLNEAIHCFLEGCNYSAVAMSVSAIEFRLLSLMTSVCPNPKLEEMPLGQLIREYLSNKDKYKKVIPEKHEALLDHCNTYRIFSVHPKKEKITKSVATSILHMTFQFLLDKSLTQRDLIKQ